MRWLLGKVLALAMLASGAWAIHQGATDPRLSVSRLLIQGADLLSAEDILELLSVEGANVFVLTTRRLQRQVETNPAIANVRVQPLLPDVVHVAVTERRPLAVWDSGSRRILVDATGLGIAEATVPGSRTLPAISAPEGPFIQTGERVDPDAVRVAQSVAPRLESLGLAGARLEYRPSSGVTLVGRHRVALGSDDEIEAKLLAYQSIRRHLDETRTSAEIIDVRFLDRPYFR